MLFCGTLQADLKSYQNGATLDVQIERDCDP